MPRALRRAHRRCLVRLGLDQGRRRDRTLDAPLGRRPRRTDRCAAGDRDRLRHHRGRHLVTRADERHVRQGTSARRRADPRRDGRGHRGHLRHQGRRRPAPAGLAGAAVGARQRLLPVRTRLLHHRSGRPLPGLGPDAGPPCQHPPADRRRPRVGRRRGLHGPGPAGPALLDRHHRRRAPRRRPGAARDRALQPAPPQPRRQVAPSAAGRSLEQRPGRGAQPDQGRGRRPVQVDRPPARAGVGLEGAALVLHDGRRLRHRPGRAGLDRRRRPGDRLRR